MTSVCRRILLDTSSPDVPAYLASLRQALAGAQCAAPSGATAAHTNGSPHSDGPLHTEGATPLGRDRGRSPTCLPGTSCHTVGAPYSRHDSAPDSCHDGAPYSRHDNAPASCHDNAKDAHTDGAPDSRHNGAPHSRPRDGAPDGVSACEVHIEYILATHRHCDHVGSVPDVLRLRQAACARAAKSLVAASSATGMGVSGGLLDPNATTGDDVCPSTTWVLPSISSLFLLVWGAPDPCLKL